MKDGELRHLRNYHPNLWQKLLDLENEPNLIGDRWNTLTNTSIHEMDEKYKKENLMKINSFNGGYAYLSNFYNAPVLFDGILYKNSEAAYQAGKVKPEKRIFFANLSPGQAKKLGRAAVIQDGWDTMKADYMRRVVHAKFMQNPTLASLLLQTGDAELEEGNTWHDNFFGNCYCSICQGIKGENMLGKILMDEREKLKGYEKRKIRNQ